MQTETSTQGRWSQGWPRPHRPRLSARFYFLLHRVLVPSRWNLALSRFIESRAHVERAFTEGEARLKKAAFGCRMCGQCALPSTGYACPQTCPKQLRNGPCGGVSPSGDCEVHPGTRCVWLVAYDRCAATGRTTDLDMVGRALDHRLQGTSSWLGYWQGRDDDLYAAREPVPLLLRTGPGQDGVGS